MTSGENRRGAYPGGHPGRRGHGRGLVGLGAIGGATGKDDEDGRGLMRGVIYDPEHPGGVRLIDLPEPRPGPSQVVIEVQHLAVNFAEVAFADVDHATGDVLGRDIAGVVMFPAADHTGPRAGTRVVAFAPAGGWAERAVVDTERITAVPDDVDLARACALPVAGLTALRAVRALGDIVGRRVMITGASGGVGRYAVQLAARRGAHVIALTRDHAPCAELIRLGSAECAVTPHGLEPVDAVVDLVGGAVLAETLTVLRSGGRALAVGMASRASTRIDFERERRRAGRRSIEIFTMHDDDTSFSADLAELVARLAAGELEVPIGWRGSWNDLPAAYEAQANRTLQGKVIAHTDAAGQ